MILGPGLDLRKYREKTFLTPTSGCNLARRKFKDQSWSEETWCPGCHGWNLYLTVCLWRGVGVGQQLSTVYHAAGRRSVCCWDQRAEFYSEECEIKDNFKLRGRNWRGGSEVNSCWQSKRGEKHIFSILIYSCFTLKYRYLWLCLSFSFVSSFCATTLT